jgi:hypothetical protein
VSSKAFDRGFLKKRIDFPGRYAIFTPNLAQREFRRMRSEWQTAVKGR